MCLSRHVLLLVGHKFLPLRESQRGPSSTVRLPIQIQHGRIIGINETNVKTQNRESIRIEANSQKQPESWVLFWSIPVHLNPPMQRVAQCGSTHAHGVGMGHGGPCTANGPNMELELLRLVQYLQFRFGLDRPRDFFKLFSALAF